MASAVEAGADQAISAAAAQGRTAEEASKFSATAEWASKSAMTLAMLAGARKAAVRWSGRGAQSVKAVETEAAVSKVPYDPRKMDRLLKERYGIDAVSSSTLPDLSKPNVKLAGKGLTIPGTDIHIPFDQRGYPVFDTHAVYQTKLPASIYQADRSTHMRHATRSLRDSIAAGEIKANLFTPEQLRQINSGSEKIRGLTWHHHAESGRMQLISEELHNLPHTGGYSLWGK